MKNKSLVKPETNTGIITVKITRYKGAYSHGLPGEQGETRYGKMEYNTHFLCYPGHLLSGQMRRFCASAEGFSPGTGEVWSSKKVL